MENFRITTDPDGVAIIWFDAPGKSVNTLGPATLSELSSVLDELERSHPAGVIFTSGKPHNFIAGADLFEMRKMDRADIEQFLVDGQEAFNRIERLPMQTVAAINGDCLGGGLELALACRHRIAASETSIKIGLPEVKLGIIPGFGGTVRLTHVAGLTNALPLMLAGKTLPPKRAMRQGIIDEVVRPEAPLDAARRWTRSELPAHRPTLLSRAAARTPLARHKILDAARQETRRRGGDHYPAALKLIDVVEEGISGGPIAGLDAERHALLELIATDTARNLMRLFFLRQGAKRAATAKVNAMPQLVEYAAVIGGGTMGAGMAHALISAGINVRLVEVNDQAVAGALKRVRTMLDQDVRDGRLDSLAARHAFNRLVPTTQWDGLGVCDFAIEAVLEKMDIKREVFARLDKLLPPNAIIASNTSSLMIRDMTGSVKNPSRVIGMHFFNPVPRMPLVEIVRTDASGDEALATAISLSGRLGKTPVVVRDAPGFLVNRVLIPYLAEAVLLAHEGTSITDIDAAMKQFGWPMGPFELLDEIGLDVGGEVLQSLAAKVADYAQIPQWLAPLLAQKALGKKTGKGFYIHEEKSGHNGTLQVNPGLASLWNQPSTTSLDKTNPDDIQWRLMLPMINEASRVLREGVTDSPDAVDLATVLGLGFPPFRGGLAHYAEAIGQAEINRRLQEAVQHFGLRFEPVSTGHSLRDMGVPPMIDGTPSIQQERSVLIR